jgi:hypothetical protein
MLYWGGGFKTDNALGLANSDVDLVRFVMEWSRIHLDPKMEFRGKLNLHAGNDESAALRFWSQALSIPPGSTRHSSSQTGPATEGTI